MSVLSGARPHADRDPQPGAHRLAAQSHGIQFGESCDSFQNRIEFSFPSCSSNVKDECKKQVFSANTSSIE